MEQTCFCFCIAVRPLTLFFVSCLAAWMVHRHSLVQIFAHIPYIHRYYIFWCANICFAKKYVCLNHFISISVGICLQLTFCEEIHYSSNIIQTIATSVALPQWWFFGLHELAEFVPGRVGLVDTRQATETQNPPAVWGPKNQTKPFPMMCLKLMVVASKTPLDPKTKTERIHHNTCSPSTLASR